MFEFTNSIVCQIRSVVKPIESGKQITALVGPILILVISVGGVVFMITSDQMWTIVSLMSTRSS